MLKLLLRCCIQNARLSFDKDRVNNETIGMLQLPRHSIYLSLSEPQRPITIKVISYLEKCGVSAKAGSHRLPRLSVIQNAIYKPIVHDIRIISIFLLIFYIVLDSL